MLKFFSDCDSSFAYLLLLEAVLTIFTIIWALSIIMDMKLNIFKPPPPWQSTAEEAILPSSNNSIFNQLLL